MDREQLTDLFYEWFTDSFPRVKPSNHTVESHVAFAAEVLKQLPSYKDLPFSPR
jgi:hypothetical protein